MFSIVSKFSLSNYTIILCLAHTHLLYLYWPVDRHFDTNFVNAHASFQENDNQKAWKRSMWNVFKWTKYIGINSPHMLWAKVSICIVNVIFHSNLLVLSSIFRSVSLPQIQYSTYILCFSIPIILHIACYSFARFPHQSTIGKSRSNENRLWTSKRFRKFDFRTNIEKTFKYKIPSW